MALYKCLGSKISRGRAESPGGPGQSTFHSLWLTLRRAEKVSDDGVCIYANGDILSIFNESKVPLGLGDVHRHTKNSAQLIFSLVHYKNGSIWGQFAYCFPRFLFRTFTEINKDFQWKSGSNALFSVNFSTLALQY